MLSKIGEKYSNIRTLPTELINSLKPVALAVGTAKLCSYIRLCDL